MVILQIFWGIALAVAWVFVILELVRIHKDGSR